VTLTKEDMRAFKTWIDLNCPLWPDYSPNRPVEAMCATAEK